MKIVNSELETVCGITSKLPKNKFVEFAFAGKSNVGKSSLINCIAGRKKLARTSGQPGKTQTINYYLMNNELYFVDLPGYGFAKVSKEVKEKWGKMIENYLTTSKQLQLIFLLIDIRHEPSKNDKDMYNWIVYNGFTPVIIATKLDKIKRSQKDKQIKLIKTSMNLPKETIVIPFSSETKQGKEEVLDIIEQVLEQVSPQQED